MADPRSKKTKPVPRHLKTSETARRADRGERTAAHRGSRTAAKARVRTPAKENRTAEYRMPERQVQGRYTGKRLYYEKLLPYAEERHQAYQRSLRTGVGWLFALPVILLVVQVLTNSSKIAILLAWIVGMFIISAALVYIAYSDHELQHYLKELSEYVPDAADPSLGNLLPVDENGGWTISAEQLRSAIAQYRVERQGSDVSIRLPHELLLKLLQHGEEDRHEERSADHP